MLQTIRVGHYKFVQEIFECDLGNGQITVRVGERTYIGTPIAH